MSLRLPSAFRGALFALSGALAMIGAASAPAQVQTVDPDKAIDGDLSAPAATPGPAPSGDTAVPAHDLLDPNAPAPAPTPVPEGAPAAAAASTTYQKDDVLAAAEGVFGKGAKGLAQMIEDLLKKQGEPNGYITGREGGGAVILGMRWGSGTLHHKVEGEKPVYWTGPSVGFDAGANAGSTFVLVYNLYDTEDLYKRFPSGEGGAYVVGGFTASYLRRGDIVLIPIRAGVGLRLGVNAGYMKFRHKANWLPF